MTRSEKMQNLLNGHKIRSKHWDETYYIYFDGNCVRDHNNEDAWHVLSGDTKTDYEIFA